MHRDSEKPRNGSKVLTNNIHNMGAIFLLLFFANFFKGFGKAMKHSTYIMMNQDSSLYHAGMYLNTISLHSKHIFIIKSRETEEQFQGDD